MSAQRVARQLRRLPSDMAIIQKLCDIYRVHAHVYSDASTAAAAVRHAEAACGPKGGGADVFRREVFLHEHMGFEHMLHEVVHVICQPPFFTLEEVPEDWLLMQFERALAAAVGRSRSVVRWQLSTATYASGYWVGWPLGRIPNYHRRHFWRDGFRVARQVGLLDNKNFPTFELPTWEALTLKDIEVLA